MGLDERSDLRANLFNVSARAFEEMAPGDIFIGRNFAVKLRMGIYKLSNPKEPPAYKRYRLTK